MPPLTLYEATVPVFIRSMTRLSAILDKGEAFALEKGLEHSQLVGGKLVADMGDLTYQIQRLSDTAKFSAVRLGGIESVSMADNEKSFDELRSRLQKTIEFLEAVDPQSMSNKEDAQIIIQRKTGDITWTGKEYVLQFAVPNFYFHFVTAYDILRSMGVPVGKADFLGR